MSKTISYVALVSALAIAYPSFAQLAQPAQPGAEPPTAPAPATTPAPSAPAAAAATGANSDTAVRAGSATLMSGMSVKDSSGAVIGEVKSVKNGVATIAMGSDSFTVDSDKLGVQNGTATINATQAELKKMLPPKK